MQDWNLGEKGIDKLCRYKDCPNCLVPAPIMVDGKENLCFLDARKLSILEPILPEKTSKGIKTVFKI